MVELPHDDTGALEGSLASSGSDVRSEVREDLSFDFVFTTYYSFVSKLARSLLKNPQDGEDVTQEVFLRVHKSLSRYDPRLGNLKAWLAKLTVNACRTHQRRNFLHRTWQVLVPPEEQDEVMEELVDVTRYISPEDHLLRGELRNAVRQALARLKPKHRAVLVLYHYMDMSCAEIADITGCPEGTVYSRLHYARRVVQAELEQQLRFATGGIEEL